MSARTTRQEARARILATFQAELDRLIPADESTPLKGSRFTDFEDQVETLARSTLPVVVEQRAALEPNARAERGGRCPRCGSLRVYLERRETQVKVLSPHGELAVPKQHCRCRSCGESFSPSGA